MIWDYIRDFIVQYITGGLTSDGSYYGGFIGDVFDTDFNGEGVKSDTWYFNIGQTAVSGEGDFIMTDSFISVGNWLATTLTIFCMCLIVVFAIWLVRWVFKAVSSAFLLK